MQPIRFKTHLLPIMLLLTLSGPCLSMAEALPATSEERASVVQVAKSVIAPVPNLVTAVAKVAADTIPAVVHIEVTQRQEVKSPLAPFEGDPFFHYFFNAPENMPRKFKRERKGLGTGMIIDTAGYILTNNHVVGGAEKIDVLLADGSEYQAGVVGTDPKTDLAVIHIRVKEPLPHVIFGDSDGLKVGDWVVAIGHPQGLDQTVTQGIISAKHRQGILDPNSYQDYLQTDAAINPGNSGGPLLNLSGHVIGVNAAIASESGGFEGIGFAIPSNIAVHVARQLIAHGKVVRGWLGVDMRDLTRAMARSMDLDSDGGVLIEAVNKGGPADSAGLRKDDVIIALDGEPVANASTLRDRVANAPIGSEITLTLLRGGKQISRKVTVLNQEEVIKRLAQATQERLGAAVRPVSDAEAQQYGMPAAQGVAIASLAPGGTLARIGFEVADIILAINKMPIAGVQDFVDIVDAIKPGQRVQITALDHRSGQTGSIIVRIK